MCFFFPFLFSMLMVFTVAEAARFAEKAEEAFDLALDYFRSADDVYHQVE